MTEDTIPEKVEGLMKALDLTVDKVVSSESSLSAYPGVVETLEPYKKDGPLFPRVSCIWERVSRLPYSTEFKTGCGEQFSGFNYFCPNCGGRVVRRVKPGEASPTQTDKVCEGCDKFQLYVEEGDLTPNHDIKPNNCSAFLCNNGACPRSKEILEKEGFERWR